jgi:serine palmitoyltransferase
VKIELKQKYKYRLILDECFSIGTLGRTGRGLTELYNVPASNVDMIVGSCANSFCSAGGFCAGSLNVVEHQVSTSDSNSSSVSSSPFIVSA